MAKAGFSGIVLKFDPRPSPRPGEVVPATYC